MGDRVTCEMGSPIGMLVRTCCTLAFGATVNISTGVAIGALLDTGPGLAITARLDIVGAAV